MSDDFPDDLQQFERELQQLKPARVSIEAARCMASQRRVIRRRVVAVLFFASAAAILIALLPRQPKPPLGQTPTLVTTQHDTKPDPVTVPEQPNAIAIPVPSMLAYRRAAFVSEDALNDLLDEHARTLPAIHGQAMHAGQYQL